MKTEWDYTTLADAYLERPDYSSIAISSLLKIISVQPGDMVCDIGAGVAHLTLMLAKAGLKVKAVEPNDAMRANGKKRTVQFADVEWFEGTGENTGQDKGYFSAVTFGSSFNVCDRGAALIETVRILKPQGWFACMWNHRSLDDPTQKQIESIIRKHIPNYDYGSRRQDQSQIIKSSGLFGPTLHLNSEIIHSQTKSQCVEAWRSHATLERQAGSSFNEIIAEIEKFIFNMRAEKIIIPYSTNIWAAQKL